MGFALISIVFAALADPASFAGPAPFTRAVSEQELVEKLRLYESIRILEVPFKQVKVLKELDVRLAAEGRFTIVRPQKVIWEITKPSPVRVTVDRGEIRIESGVGASAREQVFKSGESLPDKAAKSLTGLIAWLNLDAHALYGQYSISAASGQAYRFVPHDNTGSPFQDLEMTLAVDGHLKHLLIHEISGDSLDIEFGKPRLR